MAFRGRSKSNAPSRQNAEFRSIPVSRAKVSLPHIGAGGTSGPSHPASVVASESPQLPIKQVFQSRERLKIHLDSELERTKLPGTKKRSMRIRLKFDEVHDLNRSLEISGGSPTYSLHDEKVRTAESAMRVDRGASKSDLGAAEVDD